MYVFAIFLFIAGAFLLYNGFANHNGSEDYSIYSWLFGGLMLIGCAGVVAIVKYFLP